MARTKKRTTPRVPPVIARLLKAVSSLSPEEASQALQDAGDEETSVQNRVTLMRARIKLLQDAQKPKPTPRPKRKKPAPKVVEVEAVEEEPAPPPKPKPQGVIQSVDLNSLGALFGAASSDAEPEDEAPTRVAPEKPTADQFDLSALAELGGDDDNDVTADPAASAADGAPVDQEAQDTATEAAPSAPADPVAEVEEEPEPEPAPPFKKLKVAKSKFPEDETYCQIWEEMVTETIAALTEIRSADYPFEERVTAAGNQADRLGFAAQRMGYGDWANLMGEFHHHCPYFAYDERLDRALNALVPAMAKLQGTPAPEMPEVQAKPKPVKAKAAPPPDAAPEPADAPEETVSEAPAVAAEDANPENAAEAAETPQPAKAAEAGAASAMNALFAEMDDGESSFSNDDDIWEFDEDLSEEELAAKKAAQNADLQESDAERPVEHKRSELAVEIDETPINALAEDEKYIEIWNEMVAEAFAAFQSVRGSGDPLEQRRTQADAAADRLGYAASQLGFEKWSQLLEDFAFDCPVIEEDDALDAALDTLLKNLKALNGGVPASPAPAATDNKTESAAEATPKATAEEAVQETRPESDEAPVPSKGDASSLNALFAELGDGDDGASSSNDDDVWEFDEDLSEEELEAKNAAKNADLQESDAERPVEHKRSELAVEIDETPINALAEDEKYIEIWNEMVDEAFETLNILRRSDDAFEDRQKRADAAVDRLGYAASQLEFKPWMAVTEDFIFDCPALADDAALNAAIDTLLKNLAALRGDAPANSAAHTPPQAAEPEAEAADHVWEFDEELARQTGADAPRPEVDAPLTSYAEDDTYMSVWREMVEETLEALGVVRRSDDALEDRKKRAAATADRLAYAAGQMGFDSWTGVLETFGFDCPGFDGDDQLNKALEELIRALEALRGGAPAPQTDFVPHPEPAVEPAVEPAPAPVTVAASAPTVTPPTSVETTPPRPATPPASERRAEIPAGALLRERKATLDDLYKFFPK